MKCAVRKCSNQVKHEGSICSECLNKLEDIFDIQNKNLLIYVCKICGCIINFTSYNSRIHPKVKLIHAVCRDCEEITNEE